LWPRRHTAALHVRGVRVAFRLDTLQVEGQEFLRVANNNSLAFHITKPHISSMILVSTVLLLGLGLGHSDAFAPTRSSAALLQKQQSPGTTNTQLFAEDDADDILKPKYEIEPLPIRVGHGFDIHRMAPLEEAGQPVVIGGVTIPHKDQKVSLSRDSVEGWWKRCCDMT
jgi:hypothetical protein